MVNGGEQKPGAATGARAHGPRRGHRPGTVQSLLHSACRRSSRGYALAGLAVLALLIAWSLGVVGCAAPGSGFTGVGDTSGSFLANNTSRLERNAHYYKLMGQPELGLKELELAHRENPDNLQIIDLLAQNYEELGKFEAARQLYQEALTRRGSHPVIDNNFCFSYYTEGRWQEAEACFRKILARDPGNVAARNNLGLLYCRLDRQDEARRLWKETEGAALADAKLHEALAALGMPDRSVYAQESKPTPRAARVTPAPTPKAEGALLAAPVPAEVHAPAPLAAPQETAKPLAAKTSAPAPVVVNTRPEPPVREQAAAPKQVAPARTAEPAPQAPRVTQAPAPKADVAQLPAPVPAKVHAPAPPATPQETAKPLAAKPSAPAPAAVNTKPGPEVQKQAAAPKPATPAETPGPAAKVAPLTLGELVNTAIEIRNGNGVNHLAHKTRFMLRREGFTVARIGNHVDFGAPHTKIYYRPEMERVAREVGRTFFPEAELAPSLKLSQGSDIKVLLGQDLKGNSQFMARVNNDAPPAAPSSTDKLLATKAEAKPTAAVLQEPLEKSQPEASEVKAQPLTSLGTGPLTLAERMDTAIEVRNGNGTKNLAHETRSLLRQEGFTVTQIGNHVDFGVAKTIVYYRPGMERVAQAVGRTIFPGAELHPSLKLKNGMDIKILLGADLLKRPQLMARLVAKDK